MVLNAKLDFKIHLWINYNKVNKTNKISITNFTTLYWDIESILDYYLQIIYKTWGLDYGNIIYDEAYKNSFYQKMESVQYNASLVITAA